MATKTFGHDDDLNVNGENEEEKYTIDQIIVFVCVCDGFVIKTVHFYELPGRIV